MLRVDRTSLESFVVDLAASLGIPEDIALDLAAALVASDMCGHSSHGSRLLPAKYVSDIDVGRIAPSARPKIERDDGRIFRIDGQKAIGQAVAKQAIDEGIAKAREHGTGIVSLRNVAHIGRLGEWAERAAESGMALIGFVSNPATRWTSLPGSAQRRLSTNPLVFGLPTYDALPFPVVHDMATSQVAHGKIREREKRDEPIPDGWTVDESGADVTDASSFENGGVGAIQPLGGAVAGHKGFGLAVVSELMAGIWSEGSVSGTSDMIWGNHALFYLTDVEQYTSRARLETRINTFVDYLRQTDQSDNVPTPSAMEGNRALVPGEAEYRARQSARSEGVPIAKSDAALLRRFAATQGLSDAVPLALRDG
ncbi:MAG: Ldh family oxidoreductase [Halapricum sp.]